MVLLKNLLALAILISICSFTNGQAQYFVDPKAVFVESFEGWGTSLTWWPDVLGYMPDDVVNQITYGFFSPNELNMNIVRYTIGGTTPDNYTCGPYRPGGATESFRDGPDMPYDWSRDPRQRRILDIAISYGADKLEAFSNSPPQWMTISRCSKGNANGAPLYINFRPENADAFTEYATEVLLHFQQAWNITFTSYVPFNEPFGNDGQGWWNGPGAIQEGCHMDRPTQTIVVQSLADAMRRKNLTHIQISVADETQIDTEIATQLHFQAQGISGLYQKVNTHGYSDNGRRRRDLLHMITQKEGHVLWMDEMGWLSSLPNNMQQGLNIANRIVLDIRDMVPSAWVYWQAMEAIGAWGLIEVPYTDYNNTTPADIVYNSGFYAMKQFSKFIRKGYSIVQVSDNNALAAFDSRTNELVLVIVNGGMSSRSTSYDLTQFQSLGNVVASRTSPSEQHVSITSPAIDSFIMTYNSPPQSVSTVVISSAVPATSKTNLIQNWNFESGTPSPWTLYFGTNGGVNQAYAWNGAHSGFITTSTTDLSLNQRVSAPHPNGTTYHLTARCASSGSNAKLGVKINDAQGPEISIGASVGYKVYGLSFTANQNDAIDVYLYASRDGSDSYIDDVILH